MKISLKVALIASLSVATATASAASQGATTNPDVMVVADAKANVSEMMRPSPAKAVYYTFVGTNQITLGAVVAGVKMPNPVLVEETAEAALASQGYVRSRQGGPAPTIGISLRWGDANFWDPEPASEMAGIRFGLADRWMQRFLLGAHKSGSLSFDETARFRDAMRDDVLYVFLAAFQLSSAKPAKKDLIWTSSMTVDGRNRLRDALPVMFASAAPYFGQNSAKPLFIGDRDRRKSQVEIGEVKIVDGEVPTKGATQKEIKDLRALTAAWTVKPGR